jgi:ligand-binding sensor domain-containing protein
VRAPALVAFGACALVACEDGECAAGWSRNGEGLCLPDSGGGSADTDGGDDSAGDSAGDSTLPDSGDSAPDPDSGDSADPPDSGDSGDSADTGEEPASFAIETFDVSSFLGAAYGFYGLSVAPDHSLWAATPVGLLHFDPATSAGRLYTTNDGLLDNSPRSVLAHSDGTIWVGHLGTTSQQGEHFSVAADGTLSLIEPIAFPAGAMEVAYVVRLMEQRYGIGVGDVWMGTNEGLCVWDEDIPAFDDHAHPTHPHGYTRGIAFSPDGDVWNGDEYQLSRWHYSNDGDLSPSGDIAEYWTPWPVEIGIDAIEIYDLDATDWTLWVGAYGYGLARVDVSTDVGMSSTTLYGEPTDIGAVRATSAGNGVYLGAASGLYVLDTATDAVTDLRGTDPFASPVYQLARDAAASPEVMWAATPGELSRIRGVPF